MTSAGGLIGTPQYMSPEQGLGKDLDHRSDVYSLGIIVYEMLTGIVPFKADSAMQLLLKHINESPKAIREFKPSLKVPEHIEKAVLRALEKSPDDRPQSAKKFFDELQFPRPESFTASASQVAPSLFSSLPRDKFVRSSVIGLVLVVAAMALVRRPLTPSEVKLATPQLVRIEPEEVESVFSLSEGLDEETVVRVNELLAEATASHREKEFKQAKELY